MSHHLFRESTQTARQSWASLAMMTLCSGGTFAQSFLAPSNTSAWLALGTAGLCASVLGAATQWRRDRRSREAREGIQRLLKQSTDGVLILDTDGNILDINTPAQDLSGWTLQQLVGTNALSLFKFNSSHFDLNTSITGGESSTPHAAVMGDGLLQRKTGEPLAVELTALPVWLAGQRYTQLIIRDIAEQIQNTRLLMQSKRQMERTNCDLVGLNWLHEQLYECRTPHEVARSICETLVEMFEVSCAQVWLPTPQPNATPSGFLREHDAWELAADAGVDTQRNLHQQPVAIGRGTLGVLTASRGKLMVNDLGGNPDHLDQRWAAELGWNSLAGYVLQIESQTHALLLVYTPQPLSPMRLDTLDLLVRVASAAFEHLHREAELRQTALAKSDFLTNMSHELRAPLTAVLGFAELLANETGLEKAPQHRRDALFTIRRNGDHLLGIINDVLDLSKLESGRMELIRLACNPAVIIEEAVALLRLQAEGKGLTLRTEFTGLIPETIHTDPTRLRQILMNLVGNAVKYTEQGCITVTTRLTSVDDSPQLMIDVTDTGIGMAPHVLENLFKSANAGHNNPARAPGGIGLGLNISDRLAHMLGGRIRAVSELGAGSTFTMQLPTGPLHGVRLVVPPRANSKFDAAPVASQPLAGVRVLLADDNSDIQRMVVQMLQRGGAETTCVGDGEKAVAACLAASATESPFDVVLMDTQMPVMDGLLATAKLRASGYTRPIVALTAHTLPEHEEFCRDAGCDDFLSKPVDRIKLTDVVRIWAYRGAKALASRATAKRNAAASQSTLLPTESQPTADTQVIPVLSPS